MKLQTKLIIDDVVKEVLASTDYQESEYVHTDLPNFEKPNSFQLGLIVGQSGSGKTQILNKYFSIATDPQWDKDKSVCSHFSNYEQAKSKLGAVGLNSIPAWLRPFSTLSNGEQYRANLARQLDSNIAIDEFTSVVDRNVAKSCSYALSKYIRRKNLSNVVLASCHYDIIEWLEPDWVFDCTTGKFIEDRRLLRRPSINIQLLPCKHTTWERFSKHHYLDGNINKSSRCWLAIWDNTIVGFASAIAFPNGAIKNAYREHRTVVLPEFQGMGIGVRISDAIAKHFTDKGCRYFSKTAHPTMGEYRESSSKWKPTSKNKKTRPDYSLTKNTKEDNHKMKHVNRLCYSHEYIE
jgi:GNAT superfamily N-acetyltransferase